MTGRMNVRRRSRFATTLAAALITASVAVAAADDLDAYRRFVRTPEAHALLGAARDAMERGAAGDRATPALDGPDWPANPVGLYVTLVQGNATRACVGSATPPRGSLVESVRSLAALAMSADPRRPPVRREELRDLRIVISFAREGAAVANPYDVDPGREGLLVAGAKGAVAFLPGEARTVQWALREARRAGVVTGGEARYQRLEVVTLSEPLPPVKHSKEGDDDP